MIDIIINVFYLAFAILTVVFIHYRNKKIVNDARYKSFNDKIYFYKNKIKKYGKGNHDK